MENDRVCNISHSYKNTLMLYPLEVSIGSERKRTGVVVKVSLREKDTNIGDESLDLKVFYPQIPIFKNDKEELTTCGYSSFSHSKVGEFLTEMKIDLPFPLKRTHHLLFTISDVTPEETGGPRNR